MIYLLFGVALILLGMFLPGGIETKIKNQFWKLTDKALGKFHWAIPFVPFLAERELGADQRISDMTAATELDSADIFPVVINPGSTPTNRKITLANIITSIGLVTSVVAAYFAVANLKLNGATDHRCLFTDGGGYATTSANFGCDPDLQKLTVPNASNTVLTVSDSAVLPTDTTINETTVCLSDGTNCAASSGSQSLSQVTAIGATTTDQLSLYGGLIASTITATGTTGLQDLTFTNGTGTNVTTTSLYVSGLATLTDATVAGQAVCLLDGTNCPAGSGVPSLAQVTNIGASATNTLTLYGGATVSNLTATGVSSLQALTATLATTTQVTTTHLFATTGNISTFISSGATLTGGTIDNMIIGGSTAVAGTFTDLNFTDATGTTLYSLIADFPTLRSAGATIDTIHFASATGTYLGINGAIYLNDSSSLKSIYATSGDSGIVFQDGASRLLWDGSALWTPYVSTKDLGLASRPWATGYINDLVLSSSGNISISGGKSASSTFFLSGASALVADSGFVPTSTSVTVNGIPNQFYAFDATSTNCIYWPAGTLRTAWKDNPGVLMPKISWTAASGTGSVVWRLKARSLDDGSNLGSPFSGTPSYATGTFTLAYFRDFISMTKLPVQSAISSDLIRFELCREATNAGDTFGGPAYVEVITGSYALQQYSDN